MFKEKEAGENCRKGRDGPAAMAVAPRGPNSWSLSLSQGRVCSSESLSPRAHPTGTRRHGDRRGQREKRWGGGDSSMGGTGTSGRILVTLCGALASAGRFCLLTFSILGEKRLRTRGEERRDRVIEWCQSAAEVLFRPLAGCIDSSDPACLVYGS